MIIQLTVRDSILYSGELKKVQSLVNKDYAIIYGFNVGLSFSPIRHLNVKINYTFNRGEDSDKEPMRHVPPNYSGIHFIYKRKKLKCDLFIRYHSELAFTDLAPSEKNKAHLYAIDNNGNPYSPSWSTLNFVCLYDVNKNISINAGVENILDQRYKTYSSGMVAPGRNFIVGFKSKF